MMGCLEKGRGVAIMNVTPISHTGVGLSDQRSDGTAVNSRSESARDSAVVVNDNETAIQTLDPVRRAEQVVGAYFQDETLPLGRFSIDKDQDSGRFVYRLVNDDTGEVLKQFPGDYVLRRIAYYRDLEGLAVDSEV
jgi:uncharacterized FlaG/YvyC family protein